MLAGIEKLFSYLIVFIVLLVKAHAKLEEPGDVTMGDAVNYLQKFGYLSTQGLSESVNENTLENARQKIKRSIAMFQGLAGLKRTGVLDTETRQKLVQPRCGISDFQEQSEYDLKWDKKDLTYVILKFTDDLTKEQVKKAIASAFSKWSEVTPLNFKELEEDGDDVDIRISFLKKNHGDSNPFDGEGGILAHALWPPAGTLHFDDDEKWVVDDPQKLLLKNNNKYVYRDLLNTATHEIGHVLGLDHAFRNDSIMTAFYNPKNEDGTYRNPTLFTYDIYKIQDRYGARSGDPIQMPETPSSKPTKPVIRNGFYKVKSGQSKQDLITMFELTEQKLKELNPHKDVNAIRPGMWIRVKGLGSGDSKNQAEAHDDPCPAGWAHFEHGKKCFKISPNVGTFEDIESYCKSQGGSLASIHSDAENNFVAKVLSDSNSSPSAQVWIGYTDPDQDDIFTWTDGSSVDFESWQPSQPDNNEGDQRNVVFGSYTKDEDTGEGGRWNDINGEYNEFKGVCQVESKVSLNITLNVITQQPNQFPSVTVKPKLPKIELYGCDPGWNYFEKAKKCYYVGGNDSYIDWATSQHECVKLGSSLASIHNRDENAFIEGILKRTKYSSWAWLGGVKTEDSWSWIDGSQWGYSHWFHSEPNGDGPCLHMWPAEEGSWNDMGCSNMDWNRQYVCMKDSKLIYHNFV